ncbi:unnamed protein product [Nyctereutes procyonoides]|uniref:(raccoon dog) hypothetical protein n=1 Tax=Nyctereutes procyonoides TaxID=34880 RepID=A0A811YIC4_NYCPR|nr:unnamed protein product [Nyctereutes procyonoides]
MVRWSAGRMPGASGRCGFPRGTGLASSASTVPRCLQAADCGATRSPGRRGPTGAARRPAAPPTAGGCARGSAGRTEAAAAPPPAPPPPPAPAPGSGSRSRSGSAQLGGGSGSGWARSPGPSSRSPAPLPGGG